MDEAKKRRTMRSYRDFYLTGGELAKLTGASRSTIMSLRRNGIIKSTGNMGTGKALLYPATTITLVKKYLKLKSNNRVQVAKCLIQEGRF